MANLNSNGSLPGQKNEPHPDGALDILDMRKRLDADIQAAGGELALDPFVEGAIGTTMFDLPGSEDNTITVLLCQDNAHALPSQALVRIKSRKGDEIKQYLGIVSAGPFAEPDSLRGDSQLLVTVATRGGKYEPPYHGRVQITIMGEELANGGLCPPRFRPLPNSPVFTLSDEESTKVLKASGDIRLGTVVGYEKVVVGVPSDKKFVLPRHTAILGTTGGGKSTTVSRLVHQLHKAGVATILIDVEGEYTEIDQPTTDETMKTAMEQRGMFPEGVGKFAVVHLVGRESSRAPELNKLRSFSLRFSDLSPHAVMEILDLSEAQQERFLKTYDTLKLVLKDAGIFPPKGEEFKAFEIDELETGTPGTTLLQMIDVANVFADHFASGTGDRGKKRKADEEADDEPTASSFSVLSPELKNFQASIRARAAAARAPGNLPSWRGLLGKLWRILRLKIFDNPAAKPLDHGGMLGKGRVTVVDLSDIDAPQVNNLVIADILRGVWKAQEQQFEAATRKGEKPTPVVIIIEEAHEFLSDQRIKQMDVLFQHVAKIAKRGRKRWLGLVFVTQMPQHLPPQVFGLVNSYILHKITDSDVVSKLRRTVSGIDEGLWNRLSGLAPGQAIVSFPHMARPLLVSIDPTPCELRLVD